MSSKSALYMINSQSKKTGNPVFFSDGNQPLYPIYFQTSLPPSVQFDKRNPQSFRFRRGQLEHALAQESNNV